LIAQPAVVLQGESHVSSFKRNTKKLFKAALNLQ
jgi:hypothetical protein